MLNRRGFHHSDASVPWVCKASTTHAHVDCAAVATDTGLVCVQGTHVTVTEAAITKPISSVACMLSRTFSHIASLILNAVCSGGAWSDSISTTGWCSLDVTTNRSYTALEQLYSAGYLEGSLSHTRISQHFTNLLQMQLDGAPADAYTRLQQFVQDQLTWSEQQIAANPTDSFWLAHNLTLSKAPVFGLQLPVRLFAADLLSFQPSSEEWRMGTRQHVTRKPNSRLL